MTRPSTLFITILFMAGLVHGAETDYGQPHPKAPPEAAQYNFLKGKWDIDIRWKKPSGETMDYKATFTCSWEVAGTVFQQEWKGPYLMGREFRTYNKKTGKWDGYNFYTGGEWVPTESQFIDGKMIVHLKVNNQQGKFINRETYFNIKNDSFEMKSERSYDDGKTWVEGAYVLKGTRNQTT